MSDNSTATQRLVSAGSLAACAAFDGDLASKTTHAYCRTPLLTTGLNLLLSFHLCLAPASPRPRLLLSVLQFSTDSPSYRWFASLVEALPVWRHVPRTRYTKVGV